jgi:hypothetical protein
MDTMERREKILRLEGLLALTCNCREEAYFKHILATVNNEIRREIRSGDAVKNSIFYEDLMCTLDCCNEYAAKRSALLYRQIIEAFTLAINKEMLRISIPAVLSKV